MIKPTIGRVVWYTPNIPGTDEKLAVGSTGVLAAIVVNVWSDTVVNLAVFDANGDQYSRTSVLLIQDDAPKPPQGYYCEWMPYQIGQAAKEQSKEA